MRKSKSFLFSTFILFLLLCTFYVSGQEKKDIRLLLPDKLYAVPGHELNIYFDNIVLVPDSKQLNFSVDCIKGRQYEKRWSYIPEEKDIKKFALKLKVLDGENKVLGEKIVTIETALPNAGEKRKISVLMIGDSLTNAAIYPETLLKMVKKDGAPDLRMLGSHRRNGWKPIEGGVAHEGYSGWTWSHFLNRWDDKNPAEYRDKSPFLSLKDQVPVLDFQSYCNKYNAGKAPDFITVMLGTNDIFGATDEDIDEKIDKVFENADTLISEFKKVGPETKIGLALSPPPASSQDAFGASYNCKQTRWQFRRNQHRLVERMIQKFGSRENEKIYLVPVYVNIDCENNFPLTEEAVCARNPKKLSRQSNGVHPAQSGYEQIADTFYFWLKNILAEKK